MAGPLALSGRAGEHSGQLELAIASADARRQHRRITGRLVAEEVAVARANVGQIA
jgi:hypothetical protein